VRNAYGMAAEAPCHHFSFAVSPMKMCREMQAFEDKRNFDRVELEKVLRDSTLPPPLNLAITRVC